MTIDADGEIPNRADLWDLHPLGPPNRGTMAVFQFDGHRFAIGRYSQHADSRILVITRHLTLPMHREASRALARLRRAVASAFPDCLALSTYTTPPHDGTCYRADGWVYVANHRGKKRWVRSL